MTKRFYKVIGTTTALKNLHAEAEAAGKQAVGISTSGSLYIWNTEKGTPDKITAEQAAVILETTPEVVAEILATKGAYVIPDEAPVEAEVVEVEQPQVVEVPPVVEEKLQIDLQQILDAIESGSRKAVDEVVQELRLVDAKLADKVEALQNSVAELAQIIRENILI